VSVRQNEMVRELARAKESATSPRPAKVLSGDGEKRQSWIPEVSDGTQGALVRLKDQGLRLTWLAAVLYRRPREW